MTFPPHPAWRDVERLAMTQMVCSRSSLPGPSRGERASRHEIHALARRSIDEVAGRLGVRPDLHLDWPVRSRVAAPVARAIGDALAESLARLADHDGTTSAFVSVSWRDETVELCVVDDGRAPTPNLSLPATHLDEATGVEHDVDDYGPVGTCQWWSIPTDL